MRFFRSVVRFSAFFTDTTRDSSTPAKRKRMSQSMEMMASSMKLEGTAYFVPGTCPESRNMTSESRMPDSASVKSAVIIMAVTMSAFFIFELPNVY